MGLGGAGWVKNISAGIGDGAPSTGHSSVYFRPPPRQCEEEVPALEHKVEVSESPATEVIPVEEQAELDKINKLLNKAQGARNAHKKMVIFSHSAIGPVKQKMSA